jgi:PKD repeat protein
MHEGHVNTAPHVDAITLNPNPVLIGMALNAAATFTDEAGDTHTAAWNWGDGTISAGTIAGGTVSGSHTYSVPGVYSAEVQVTDNGLLTGSSTATATAIYKICILYNTDRAARIGSTMPIKLSLCNAANTNLSSPAIVVHLEGVEQASTQASGPIDDAGQSNPDLDFRYDATLGTGGGYILNLSTRGMTTGTYQAKFTVGAQGYEYGVPFQVR